MDSSSNNHFMSKKQEVYSPFRTKHWVSTDMYQGSEALWRTVTYVFIHKENMQKFYKILPPIS